MPLIFYLEMSLNLDVITGSFRNDHPLKSSTHNVNSSVQEEVLKIDGLFHQKNLLILAHGILQGLILQPTVCSALNPEL